MNLGSHDGQIIYCANIAPLHSYLVDLGLIESPSCGTLFLHLIDGRALPLVAKQKEMIKKFTAGDLYILFLNSLSTQKKSRKKKERSNSKAVEGMQSGKERNTRYRLSLITGSWTE